MLLGSIIYALAIASGALRAQDAPAPAANTTDNTQPAPGVSAAPAVSGPPVQVDRSGVTFVFAAAPTNLPQANTIATGNVNAIGATNGNGQAGQVVSAVNADFMCTPGTLLGQFIVSSIPFLLNEVCTTSI
jgi:hypothetical protein